MISTVSVARWFEAPPPPMRGAVWMPIASTCSFWGLAPILLADATANMFTRPLFGAAFVFAPFGERPDTWIWIGGAIIFAATVVIARRGRRRLLAPPAASP